MKTTDHEHLDADLLAVITNLRVAATASAEEQRHHAPPQRRKLTAFAWSFAAAVLAICIYVPHMPRHPQTPPTQQPQIVAQEQAPAISDDVLLADIQDDLSASLPTPMLPLTTTTTTTKSTTQRK